MQKIAISAGALSIALVSACISSPQSSLHQLDLRPLQTVHNSVVGDVSHTNLAKTAGLTVQGEVQGFSEGRKVRRANSSQKIEHHMVMKVKVDTVIYGDAPEGVLFVDLPQGPVDEATGAPLYDSQVFADGVPKGTRVVLHLQKVDNPGKVPSDPGAVVEGLDNGKTPGGALFTLTPNGIVLETVVKTKDGKDKAGIVTGDVEGYPTEATDLDDLTAKLKQAVKGL